MGIYRKHRRAGFTLVELAIVLGVVGALFAGLWALLSSSNRSMRDQSAANQQKQLIAAVRNFLQTPEGKNWMAAVAPTNSAELSMNCTGGTPATFCTLLPQGMNAATTNAYNQTYQIRFRKEDNSGVGTVPGVYSFMIKTTGGDTIPDTSGGSIAAMIGGDGGFIYGRNVCGAQFARRACGAYGGWMVDNVMAAASATPRGYGFAASASGQIASRSYHSSLFGSTEPWLAREYMGANNPAVGAEDVFFNRMITDLFLGGRNMFFGVFNTAGISNGGAINAQGGIINMNVAGNNSGGGTINVQQGSVNFQGGTINMSDVGVATGGGTMNVQGGLINLGAAGRIEGVSNVALGIPFIELTAPSNIGGNPLVNIVGTNACMNAPGAPSNCKAALQVTGDVIVSGLLSANMLWAGTHLYESDERLKKDIRPLKGSISDLMKLRPVSFVFKDGGRKSMGVIAQELENVFPELVATIPEKETKAVDYNALIGLLIGSVQDLKKENEGLRKDMEMLKERLDKK